MGFASSIRVNSAFAPLATILSMTHLGWYSLGKPVEKLDVTVFSMEANAEGELVRMPVKQEVRMVRTMCGRDVPANYITTDVTACVCAECSLIHAKDLSR